MYREFRYLLNPISPSSVSDYEGEIVKFLLHENEMKEYVFSTNSDAAMALELYKEDTKEFPYIQYGNKLVRTKVKFVLTSKEYNEYGNYFHTPLRGFMELSEALDFKSNHPDAILWEVNWID